jgi:hypothetical protein
MNKYKTEEQLGKGISLLFIASFFTEQAKSLLESSKWFRHENKKLLNLLIEKNYYLVEAEKKLNKLMSDDEELKKNGLLNEFQGDADDVKYLWNAEKEMFINFMRIFLEADDRQIESVSHDLSIVAKGEKLYSFDTLKSLLNRWNNMTGNKVIYNEEFINEFLNEYK